MKLQEVFDQLTYGELSKLALGNEGQGIQEERYPAILAHINLGLVDLYKRFNLKEGRLTVELQPGRMTYPLSSKFAASNTRSQEPVKYILDNTEPFKDDLIKVERVYTGYPYEMGLNDSEDQYSIHTPSLNSIRVPGLIVDQSHDLPEVYKGNRLTVAYRAYHPKITIPIGFFDPARVDLELPDAYLWALLLFVASRVNNPMGMTNEFNAGNNYAAKYEAECLVLLNQNIRIDEGNQTSRFERGGWV